MNRSELDDDEEEVIFKKPPVGREPLALEELLAKRKAAAEAEAKVCPPFLVLRRLRSLKHPFHAWR
jgi:hypothetical protein